jgi:Domain of unknown function DUF140.
MHCANCGTEVVPGARFCQNCGSAVPGTPEAVSVSPTELPVQVVGSSADNQTAIKPSSSTPTRSSRKKQWVARLWRLVLTILVTVIIGKILGYLSPYIYRVLAQADDFVWTGVTEGQPFHFCAVFYREWIHGGSPPVAFVRAIGDILKEGPAAVLTMALALFIGIVISYDRKNLLTTLYTSLFLGPIIGGCLLYVLMAMMLGLSVVFHVGASACAYLGGMVSLVKEGVGVAIESNKEKVAEKLVDRISGEVPKKV